MNVPLVLVQGVFPNSNGDSPSSSSLRPRLVNSAHSATALKSEFSDIHGEIRSAHGPLERACKENDLKSVVATFAGFQKSFQALANSCSKTYNQNRKSPVSSYHCLLEGLSASTLFIAYEFFGDIQTVENGKRLRQDIGRVSTPSKNIESPSIYDERLCKYVEISRSSPD
jgi:hypothetical protein